MDNFLTVILCVAYFFARDTVADMNNMQDSLVDQFCQARVLYQDEYRIAMSKYEPVRDMLVEYMVENNISEIILSDTERLELKSYKKEGNEIYTIWWRKDKPKGGDNFDKAIEKRKEIEGK